VVAAVFRRAFCILTLLLAAAVVSPASDLLLVHGHIYTANSKATWAEASAISGTKIDAVGSGKDVLTRRDAKTQVIDLLDRMPIPGSTDSQAHLLLGATAVRGANELQ